jgi:pimeloyl-ACP methyl ester carboxylesterase
MIALKPLTVALALGLALPHGAAAADNIVLVHGMNMDGSVWRAVYDRLEEAGHHVTIAQMPMTSIEADIAAVRRAIEAQDGPVVLVGHSYGGMVITQAGIAPAVKALVYIAAYQPDVGESLALLNTSVPAALPADAIRMFDDGFYLVDQDAWVADVATGLPEAEARFSAAIQSPVNSAIFGYEAEHAAWRNLPVWSAIAKGDRTTAPELQRQMSERSKATVVELDGGHLLPVSHPDEVVALIEAAAEAVR